MKHVLFSPQSRLQLVNLMGDDRLRCLSCQGKFGRIIANLRCEPCGLIFRLQDVLYSDRFPAGGSSWLTPDLRAIYLKTLEISDTYSRGLQGDKGSPRIVNQAEGERVAASKAKPAVKGDHSPVSGGAGPVKIEEEIENKEPLVEAKELSKSPRKEKKSKPAREGDKERARSSGANRERERSPRRSTRAREEIDREEKRGGSRNDRSPLRRDRRALPRDERKERDREESRARRSPLRPRSPSGPPPPREDPSRRWRGPIPAFNREGSQGHHSQRPERYNDGRREPQNKGKKKRRQQALFSEFKAWRKRVKRNRWG